jgi:hypothetical protein
MHLKYFDCIATVSKRFVLLFLIIHIPLVGFAQDSIEFNPVRVIPLNMTVAAPEAFGQPPKIFLLPGDIAFLALPDRLYRYAGPLREETTLEELAVPDGVFSKDHVSRNPTLVFRTGGSLFIMSGIGGKYLSVDGGQSFHGINPESALSGRVTWMQDVGGRLYCNPNNLSVSLDGGWSWNAVQDSAGQNVPGWDDARIAGHTLLVSGRDVTGYVGILRGILNEQGTQLVSSVENIQPYEFPGSMSGFAYNHKTGTILLAASGMLRSTDEGMTFHPTIWQTAGPASSGDVASFFHHAFYANVVLAGGYTMQNFQRRAWIATSVDDGRTWNYDDSLLAEYGHESVLLTADIDGRILAGIMRWGEHATLTIGELILPDPVKDAAPDAAHQGEGWWTEPALGRFNALYYPALWLERTVNWFVHPRAVANSLDTLFDPSEGWVRMVHYPYAWDYAAGEWIYYVPGAGARAVLRHRDGQWQ